MQYLVIPYYGIPTVVKTVKHVTKDDMLFLEIKSQVDELKTSLTNQLYGRNFRSIIMKSS